ncbi:MAG: hypothetical protein GY794_21615 [bacterium]|nr:hypothetical protein [bacterium]
MKTLTEPKTSRKIGKKAPKEVTSIRLDPALHARAKKCAEAEDRSFSQYVELALKHYITESDRKQQQTAGEQQELAKLVQPGDAHGVWSAYDEFKAAEQMQALLESTRS